VPPDESLETTEHRAAALFDATLSEAVACLERARRTNQAAVLAATAAIVEALKAGAKLLVFGNGGSAADAQHVAAELVGRFQRDRPALAALALTTDTSILTSVGNDFGYESVFARQVHALGRPGDVVLAISTSGRSPNVIAALAAARERGLRAIGLTGGNGGEVGQRSDIHIHVDSPVTARVQEVHRALLHVICDLVERAMGETARPSR
jgi:D-sedoheptulose 7-phosphate isomerase